LISQSAARDTCKRRDGFDPGLTGMPVGLTRSGPLLADPTARVVCT
jgi:hypothetical protein